MSDKYSKRKVKSSSITTVVSLSLVLFMLGLLGILVLNATKLSTNIKENIGFQIIVNNNTNEDQLDDFKKSIESSPYARVVETINKEEAAKRLQVDLGEDFINFLGYNPLLASINVKLNATFANTESIEAIEQELLKNKIVKEIVYQKTLISVINENVNKISIVILIFTGLLMIIALALINNTIRLSIYSKRFIIKTMQLVGATQHFIRLPFVLKGIRHGIVGALLAIVALIGVLYFAQKQLPELAELQDIMMLLNLFGIVILLGIIISWISTSMAVRKYLRIKSDELYY